MMIKRAIKTIEFNLLEDTFEDPPKPQRSSKFFPKWFKELPKDNHEHSGSVRRCQPFLDAVSEGYVIPSWFEMEVVVGNCAVGLGADGQPIHPQGLPFTYEESPEELVGQTLINQVVDSVYDLGFTWFLNVSPNWRGYEGRPLMGSHPVEQFKGMSGFLSGNQALKLNNIWSIQTPKGWSVRFRNIPNFANSYHDLCFVEANVDTDAYHGCVNLPFVLKDGVKAGKYLIPKGTPLIQVIPFKRGELTKVSFGKSTIAEQRRIDSKLATYFTDAYKQLFWHKRKTKPD